MKKSESFSISPDCEKALALLPAIFDEAVPLNQKHRLTLGRTIRSLWEDLTSEREHRASEYLGAPAYYSAYIRYFLPWNIMRLSAIFGSLPFSPAPESSIIDIGSGPLTLPISLYLARPDLRDVPLTIYCSDKTERILKVGKVIFESLCVKISSAIPPWKIVLVHKPFGAHLSEKVDFLTAANVFNEFFWKSKEPIGVRALATARQLLGYVKDEGGIFLMEPGDPRSGTFISAIRAALSKEGFMPAAPCPHFDGCPMPGLFRSLKSAEDSGEESRAPIRADANRRLIMPKFRGKYPWCHFSIEAGKAPSWLKTLSGEAGLPKEKLVFSYLYAVKSRSLSQPGRPGAEGDIRIVSDAFPLPGGYTGRYACSPKGYSLVKYLPPRNDFASGDLVQPPPKHLPGSSRNSFTAGETMDEKSGAVVISY